MYRSPSRGNRSRGFKVKHILQICLLVAVCFWLVYQVKHSHEKKKEFDEKDGKLASDTQSGNENLRLGRKDISRVTETGIEDKLNGEDDEESEKHEDDEQETEENKTIDIVEDEEDTAKGGEDDDIERIEEEKHEEDEIVDEEKDKSEDNDDGDKEGNEESEALLDDQEHEGGERNTQQEREEHYKADDASSEVATSVAENGTLKHINGDSELIIDAKENISQSHNQSLLEENSRVTIEGANSSDFRVPESMENKDNLTVPVYSSSENSTDLDHPQVTNNMTQAQNATSEDNHNATLSLVSHTNTSNLASDENKLVDSAVTNSTEIMNTTSGELLNSSSDVNLGVANNSTDATETKVDDEKSVDTENNVTGEEDDNVGADLHDHVDEFASSLTQEEKENRIDPGTLPDIDVGVQNNDDIEAE